MNLQNKLDLCRLGTLLADELVMPDALPSYEVKIKNKGNNLLFEKNVSFQSTILPTPDPVFLGAYSYMNEDGYIRGPVFIGRFCSIGRRVSIGAGMHSFSGISSHPLLSSGSIRQIYSKEEIEYLGLKERTTSGVIIGSDVWIGDGVVILPGVTIGEGSVIGANSVVNKDIAPYSVIGGLPARLLRHRFSEGICTALSASNWWEYDLDVIKAINYKNVYEFLRSDIAINQMNNYPTFKFSGFKREVPHVITIDEKPLQAS